LRKQAFYYNIYKDIYVFFKEYGQCLWKTGYRNDLYINIEAIVTVHYMFSNK